MNSGELDAFRACAGELHVEAGLDEDRLDHFADISVVFDDDRDGISVHATPRFALSAKSAKPSQYVKARTMLFHGCSRNNLLTFVTRLRHHVLVIRKCER